MEEMPLERGISVSYQTIHCRAKMCGASYADRLHRGIALMR